MYVPPLTSLDGAKGQFYEDMAHLIKATLPSDKLKILRDFNTRAGKVSNDWKRSSRSSWCGKPEQQQAAPT